MTEENTTTVDECACKECTGKCKSTISGLPEEEIKARKEANVEKILADDKVKIQQTLIERSVEEFVPMMNLLSLLIENSTRGGFKRALMNGLRSGIDDVRNLSNPTEKKMAELIGRLIELKVIIMSEVLKMNEEDKFKKELKEKQNG